MEENERTGALPSGLADEKVSLGNFLKKYGEVEEAVAHYEQAVQLEPNRLDVRFSLGSALTDLGRFEEAVAQLEHALQINPNFAPAYQVLGDLASQDEYQFSSERLECMKNLLASKGLPSSIQCILQFTLADVLDKQGDFDNAFRYYQAANDIQQRIMQEAGTTFNPDEYRRTIERTISTFGRTFIQAVKDAGLDSEIPVFVVGMPRSGTTLVEQVIASHPEAAGAGELQDIAQLAITMPESIGAEDDYPQCVLRADSATLTRLAQNYLDGLTERRGKHVRRIVDKTPANFLFLGFITAILPNARIIHCLREPLDACLSCYCRSFNSVTWASRLEDIALFYREYQRLTAHWRQVLPTPMFEIVYEQLVGDPETVARKLVDFCGLSWNDQCLNHHRTAGPVLTSSRVQVRRPIYSSSVGRWKHYERQMAPLKLALEMDDPTSP